MNTFKKNFVFFSGLFVFAVYYFANLINYFKSGGESFFLSTEMITDSAYLPLLLRDDILFGDGINFFFFPFIIERFFIELIGFNNIWISLLIYKAISILILIIGFIKIYDLKDKYSYILFISLFIGVLFCIDIPPFNDRYPRPAFSNIFFYYIFVANIFLALREKISSNNLLSVGFAGAILSFANPWQGACMGLMTLFTLYKANKLKEIYIPLISFFAVLIPVVILFTINGENSFHSSYLGLKEIYNPLYFILDFYIASITSEQIILSVIILCTLSYILKRSYEFNVFILCFALLPLPFVLLGYTLQSNHFLIIIKSLLILLMVNQIICIAVIDSEKAFKKVNHFKYFQHLSLLFLISIFSVNTIFLGSSWIERAEQRHDRWERYHAVFNLLDKYPNTCELITNDNDLKIYWRNLSGGETYPKDGFVQTSSIEKTLNDISISKGIMSEYGDFSPDDEKELIKYSTHNFFSSSRSWISPEFPFETNFQKDNYLKTRLGVDSMQTWNIDIPSHVQKILDKDYIDPYKFHKNYFVVLISKDKEKINFSYLDKCENF